MEWSTGKGTRVAGFLWIAYLFAWVDQTESFTKPEFMLPSQFLHQPPNQVEGSPSGNEAGAYSPPPHLPHPHPYQPILPQPHQYQPVVMFTAAPPMPAQHSIPISDYLEGTAPQVISSFPPLPLGQVFSFSGPTSSSVDPGMRLKLSEDGTLLIISTADAQYHCPYQGFHPLGPTYESAYLVCIPGEDNTFIGIEVNCPKGQLFSHMQARCVGEGEVEKEKQMIRMLETMREMRERELVPYVMGRVNDADGEHSGFEEPLVLMEVVEEPVTFVHVAELQGLGQTEELDGTEMVEFFEHLFVKVEQEEEVEHLVLETDRERILELAELLEKVEEREEFGERDGFMNGEVVGEDWEEGVQTSTNLEETDQVEILEAGTPFLQVEDGVLEVQKEKSFDELSFDEVVLLESPPPLVHELASDDVQEQELQAEVNEVEQFNFDVVSELLRAEDWVMVDNLHELE